MNNNKHTKISICGNDNILGNYNTVNKYFTGEYERLLDVCIDPWPIFEQVDLDNFVGREWLLKKVDSFLSNNDRGYLILEAEAGLGKTTFLAWLVQQRGYINHFVSLAPGTDGVAVGLKNLAAQLVLTCHLDPYSAEEVLPNAAGRSDFLSKLLKQAAKTLSCEQKIVFVVDALDEAGFSPKHNPMNLPETLPKGIFFLVSQRPTAPQLYVDPATTSRLRVSFHANDTDNREDMRRYLRKAATRPNISRMLKLNNMNPDYFVHLLMNKCNGLWIYLSCFFNAIENGEELDIDNLPDGIVQYYARYWGRWCQEKSWHTQYLPVVSTLAATQTAISVERLVKWAGIEMEKSELCQLLEQSWSSYITIERNEQEDRYRLYHATLRDFFNGVVKDTRLTNSEVSFIKAVASATQEAHNRIVNYYLEKWGGLGSELIHQFDTGELSPEDNYAIRHIVKHMVESKRDADLHTLLKLERSHNTDQKSESEDWLSSLQEWWRLFAQYRTDNIWYQARQEDVAGYLTDIARARKLVAHDPKEIGMQIRYTLISSSIRSQVQNLSTDLLYALVKEELLTPQQGLAHARQIPDSLIHLATIVHFLPESERPPIIQEILRSSKKIVEREKRAQIIFKLQSSAKEFQSLRTLDSDTARNLSSIQRVNEKPEVKGWINDLVSSNMYWSALRVIQTLPNPATQFEHLLSINKHLPISVSLDAWNYIIHEDMDVRTRLDFALRCLPLLIGRKEAVTLLTRKIQADFREKEKNFEYKIPDEVVRDIFSLLAASPLEQRLMGTVLLLPYMSPSTLDKVAAKTLKDMKRVNAVLAEKIMINLLSFMPKDARDNILHKYWIKSREIGDKEVSNESLYKMHWKLRQNGFLLESFQVARKIKSRIDVRKLATDLANSGYEEEAFECAEWDDLERVPLNLLLVHNALPKKNKSYANMLKKAASSITLLFLVDSIVCIFFAIIDAVIDGMQHVLLGNREEKLETDNEPKDSNSSVWLSEAWGKTSVVVTLFLFSLIIVPVFSLSKILFGPILRWVSFRIFVFCRSHVLVKLPGVQTKILIFLTEYMSSSKHDQVFKEIEQIMDKITVPEEQRAARQRFIQQAVDLNSLRFARSQLKKTLDDREWFTLLANFPVSEGEEYYEIFRKDVDKRSSKYLRSVQASDSITDIIANIDWLMPILVKYNPPMAHNFWNKLSSHISWLPRSESLQAIEAMMPFIASIGGVDAVTETTEAVEDVFHWWP
jgi:hypothetical protein